MSESSAVICNARRPRPAAPLVLFVHGAFASPWVWKRHFMPHLAGEGIDSIAIYLPGADQGVLDLPGPCLQDYVHALHRAVHQLGRTVVVVGHSLGALVAQLALVSVTMAGLVLMAPVPPTGMAWSSLRLATAAPGLWTHTALSAVDAGFASVSNTRATLFGSSTPEHTVRETHEQMRSQPVRPLMEAQWPQPVPPAGRHGVPVRVIAADGDRLIPIDVVERVAAHHGCQAEVVAGCGHALMLDVPWRESAAHLLSFIDELCL